MSGGTAPYSYVWTPAVSSFSTARGLFVGSYNIKAKDKNGCSEEFAVKLKQQNATVLDVQTNIKAPDCGADNGIITLLPSRGAQPYLYLWQSPIDTNEATINNLAKGTYSVTVKDANGCAGSVTNTLYKKPLTASLGNDTFFCPGKTILLLPGTFSSYSWNNGSTQPTRAATTPGTYSVTVSNAAGCTAKANILIELGCGNVIFPSAFTPNGDLLNDQFGPVGSLSKLKKYSLLIYNRFGSLVFRSQNPYEKWKGKVDKLPEDMGTYVFIAQY